MDIIRSSTYAVLWLLCFMAPLFSITGCLETERKALLKFKDSLEDPTGRRLSSWVGQDCCRWRGLRCNNKTGHVIHLNLRNTHLDDFLMPDSGWSLGGEISPSLLDLKHLTYLDLSWNNFSGIRIPSFIGSFERLRYLNLSGSGFNGTVPHQLGNLSSLRYLDLYYTEGYPTNSLEIDSSRWLSHLYSLQYLNLGFTNLSKASDLIQSLNTLPLLLEVHLSGCGILKLPPSLPHINFTFLSSLDLSVNYINSTVPDWLFNISSLEYLDLSYNRFQDLVPDTIGNLTSLKVLNLVNLYGNGFLGGGIPTTLGNLCKLRTLDMSGNNFDGTLTGLGQTFSGCIKYSLETLTWSHSDLTGHLPDWLGDLKNLKTLDLCLNSLYGSIPLILPSSLQVLDLSGNKLNGSLSEAHFVNLTRLQYLYISYNSLVLNVSLDWVPPLQLTYLSMGSCTIGPRFPPWLRKLENISYIEMSNVGISDNMPDWFWNSFAKLHHVDLSHNGIKGTLPNSFKYINLEYVDLSSNYFEGQLPQFSSSLQDLHLSNNSFSGTIPPNIGMPNMRGLFLSSNNLNGNIPLSICKLKNLGALDLSENNLAGEIPDCWNNFTGLLYVVDLGNNNLTGGIPNSICSSPYLRSLHLSNNSLSGEFPISLKTCEKIVTLDLGQNKFMGSIPIWIGEKLLSLKFFLLRSNMFVGNIPPTLGNLYNLQVVDLAHNNLSGLIPHSFGNFSAMKFAHEESKAIYRSYSDKIIVGSKGRDLEYDELLPLVYSIDLSDNNLSGEIPEQIATLSALQTLNLSRNHLTGKIIQNISGLGLLETLDLSENNLWGAIPPTMAALHSLGSLNLSYNNLSGKIPFSGQLQALPDPSIYIGNHDLCGFPLNTKCRGDERSKHPGPVDSGEEDEDEMVWFYLSMVLGFVVGFWAVCGLLLFKKKWRIAYFRFVDNMYDRIYVAVAVNVARMKTRSYF